jgi:hypothetical protein
MSTPIIDKFSSFQLTSEEQISGSIYSLVQLQVLQNLLSESAHSRIALNYDPLNPVDFAQQEAFLKGKIELLSYLIENSQATAVAAQEAAMEVQYNQSHSQY